MKTDLERKYEKIVIYHICNLETTLDIRAAIFQDFHEHSYAYYENLCDILYAISTGILHGSLWLTISGQFYASTHRIRESDTFIIKSDELPSFDGDLPRQLEMVFFHAICHTGLKDKAFPQKDNDIVATTP